MKNTVNHWLKPYFLPELDSPMDTQQCYLPASIIMMAQNVTDQSHKYSFNSWCNTKINQMATATATFRITFPFLYTIRWSWLVANTQNSLTHTPIFLNHWVTISHDKTPKIALYTLPFSFTTKKNWPITKHPKIASPLLQFSYTAKQPRLLTKHTKSPCSYCHFHILLGNRTQW